MCDKTNEIVGVPSGFDHFHPAYRLKSMKPYQLDDLTKGQQEQLNVDKTDTVRENNKYLNSHPEVRAIIALIFRTLLKERPKGNFYETIAKHLFLQPAIDLRKEVDDYINERKSVVKKCEIYIKHSKSPEGASKKSKRKSSKGKTPQQVSFDGKVLSEEQLGNIRPTDPDYSDKDSEENALDQIHHYVQKHKEREKEEEEEEEYDDDDNRSIQFNFDDYDDDIMDAHDLSMMSMIGERSLGGSASSSSGTSSPSDTDR